eukprot:CAMPEP_0113971918 /NCGR_PEP_ID=MMETSP0011_2-20120614/12772_1 /TAXON_ID=101924 /ORGANISM="Rhodosorus marinus" /LENGTH=197 /DNA_ID=CAMNT_0000988005 /DNA_START=320 /DNA_END=914 /DNA_ORIENTATION=+ /assembly_acc=CAM_ASM_000156
MVRSEGLIAFVVFLFDRAKNWYLARTEVGRDKIGNVYYLQRVKGRTEKRLVDYANGDATLVSKVPNEWWSWLHYSRPDPPTPREIEISDAKAADLKRRVKALEEEDAKERVRQFASKMSSYDEHAQAQPQTVEQIAFRAMGGREEAGTTRSQNVSAEERDTHASPHMNEESAPQGEGESFRPGEWKPSTMRRRGRSG